MADLYMALAARRHYKFRPRHFLQMVEWFAPLPESRWTSELDHTEKGFTFIIRAPDSYSLSELGRAKKRLCVFDYISDDEYRHIVRKDAKILFDLGWEALFPRKDIVAGLYSELLRHGIDTRSVTILNSNLASEAAFGRVWSSITDHSPCKIIGFPISLALIVGHQAAKADESAVSERWELLRHSTRQRQRKFNFFNGRARAYRMFILAFLRARGLVDEGYVSMMAYDVNAEKGNSDGLSTRVKALLKQTRNYPGFEEISPCYDDLVSSLPITLDATESAIPTGTAMEDLAWESQETMYYDQSFVSFVSDTLLFDDNMIFMTEKIAKPVMNGSPFIYLGNPGALKQFRELGFHTFSPWLEESYDQCLDPLERLRLWLREAERLARLSHSDLDEIRSALLPQIESNYWHFWNRAHGVIRDRFVSEVIEPILQ